MAFVFDATCGGPTANSYVSVGYADEYVEGSAHAQSWPTTSFGADLETKQKALVSATRILERQQWNGTKATLTQRLQLPRIGLVDRDGLLLASDQIPRDAAEATCELALTLAAGDPGSLVDETLLQFKRLKIGSVIDLEMRDGVPNENDLPQTVLDLISHLLLLSGGTTRVVRA